MVSNELVKIEVLKFLKISNSLFEKVALAAFLQMNIDDLQTWIHYLMNFAIISVSG